MFTESLLFPSWIQMWWLEEGVQGRGRAGERWEEEEGNWGNRIPFRSLSRQRPLLSQTLLEILYQKISLYCLLLIKSQALLPVNGAVWKSRALYCSLISHVSVRSRPETSWNGGQEAKLRGPGHHMQYFNSPLQSKD